MLFTNSLVPAAIALTSAKRTELYLLAHKNTRSRIKKVLYTNIFDSVIISNKFKACIIYQTFSPIRPAHILRPTKNFFTETVRSNTKIIDSDDNWNLLLYKEAYHIKRSSPSLNNGLKLCLFSWQYFFLFLFCTYFIVKCLLMLIYHPFSI